jgi:hypothetical protein
MRVITTQHTTRIIQEFRVICCILLILWQLLHGSYAITCVGISGEAGCEIGGSAFRGGTHAYFSRIGAFHAAEIQIWPENTSSVLLLALA